MLKDAIQRITGNNPTTKKGVLILTVNQVEPEALYRISKVTNTKVVGPYQRPSTPNCKPYYVITVTSKRAQALIDLLWPYFTQATKNKYYRAIEKINAL